MLHHNIQSNENQSPLVLPPTVDHQSIVQYYDQCEIDYRWVWHLGKQNAMHYGYWDESTPNLRTALHNMNDQVIHRLDLSSGMSILDAGCGVGGTSIYIADRHDVSIHGITLSEHQVSEASKRKSSLTNQNIRFSVRDYTKTGFTMQSFDRVYAMESVCHANEKRDFLAEAYRLLKPGGILVITDFFRKDTVNKPSDIQALNKWAETWAVPAFEQSKTFINKAESVGFKVVSVDDATENIKKSAKRLYKYFYPGIAAHHILKFLRFRNATQEKNVWSTYYQYKTLSQGLWQYNILKLVKQ